jgi:hypothetical protein
MLRILKQKVRSKIFGFKRGKWESLGKTAD